jgi:hypothetical protein
VVLLSSCCLLQFATHGHLATSWSYLGVLGWMDSGEECRNNIIPHLPAGIVTSSVSWYLVNCQLKQPYAAMVGLLIVRSWIGYVLDAGWVDLLPVPTTLLYICCHVNNCTGLWVVVVAFAGQCTP